MPHNLINPHMSRYTCHEREQIRINVTNYMELASATYNLQTNYSIGSITKPINYFGDIINKMFCSILFEDSDWVQPSEETSKGAKANPNDIEQLVIQNSDDCDSIVTQTIFRIADTSSESESELQQYKKMAKLKRRKAKRLSKQKIKVYDRAHFKGSILEYIFATELKNERQLTLSDMCINSYYCANKLKKLNDTHVEHTSQFLNIKSQPNPYPGDNHALQMDLADTLSDSPNDYM